jgi:hypothetical protein
MAVVCSLACGSGRSSTEGSMPIVFSSASKTGSTPKISVYRWAPPAGGGKAKLTPLMGIGEANTSRWMIWIAALSRSTTNRFRASGISGVSSTSCISWPCSRAWIRVKAKVRST